MAKFEVGKTYYVRSIGDSDIIYSGTVLKRTACTVTMDVKHWGVRTLRILKDVSAHYGSETVRPLGNYSMCPHFTADRVLAA